MQHNANEKRLLEDIDFHRRTIDELRKENEMLKNELDKFRKKVDDLTDEMVEMRTKMGIDEALIVELRNKIGIEEALNAEMRTKMGEMINKTSMDEALVVLSECVNLVNREFQKCYRIVFRPKRNEHIPTFFEMLENMPREEDEKEYYDFCVAFIAKYNGSDRRDFKEICQRIKSSRNANAHPSVRRLNANAFDDLMNVVAPDIAEHTRREFRDWLYMFPA